MSQRLVVRILTWNMGKNSMEQKDWENEIRKSWGPIAGKDGDYDCLLIALQEDHRGKYGKFKDAVNTIINGDFVLVEDSVEGPPELSKLNFSVRTLMYLRTSVFGKNFDVRKNNVCLKRTVYCTKATAGVAVIANINGKIIELLFMGSHLPIDTNTDDLGYADRIAAIETSMKEVYDKLEDATIKYRAAFWAGDLNFRKDTPFKSGGNPTKDQLKHALSTRPAAFFREFVESEDPNFNPTCKRPTCKDGVCPRCRASTTTTSNTNCYDTDKSVQDEEETADSGKTGFVAGAKQAAAKAFTGIKRVVTNKSKNDIRNPSHCDRILYRLEDIDAILVEYKSWSGAQSVQNSDHDVVIATFELLI